MKRTVALLVALGYLVVAVAQQRDIDVKFRIAQGYERNNDWDNAIKLYEELYANDSTNVVLFESLRRGYLQLKRYDDAIRLIETRLRFRPNDVVLLSQLGVVLARAGKDVQAVEVWNHALTIDKRNLNTYRVIANAALENRMFDRAVDYYLQARSEFADPTLFAVEIANLYSLMMNFADATKEYLSLLRQNPSQMALVQSRMGGFTYRSDGRLAAIRVVEDALKSQEDNVALHQLLAWILMEGKEFEKAYDVYLQIDQRTNAGGRELYNFAERALREKAYKVAAKSFKTIIDRHPAFDRMGASKFGYARALEESIAPQDSAFLSIASKLLFLQSRDSRRLDSAAPEVHTHYASVIAAYEEVIQRFPKSEIAAHALYRMAVIKFNRLFDVDGAITVLRRFDANYRTFPQRAAEAKLLHADAMLAKGNLEETRSQYRSVTNIAAAPAGIKEQAQYSLAEIEFYKGNFQEALTALQNLVKNPKSDIVNDALTLLMLIQEHSTHSAAALREFAQASLLIRQRKLPDAVARLENVQRQYPASQLAAEALMLEGDALISMKRYADGIGAYEHLIDQFSENILVEKAQMKIAVVHQWKLNDKTKAIAGYQSLLEKFPGSIYAAEARKQIRELRGDNL